MDRNDIDLQESGVDRQVGALLGHVRRSASIIDDLMALPLPDDEGPREWNQAVTRRLERKLADAMRAVLQSPDDKRRRA